MNTLRKINLNMGSDDLYSGETMKMAYSTARDILEQTLENFGNLQEFKVDFLGKFIRARDNRNRFKDMYRNKGVELQLEYQTLLGHVNVLGDGQETE
jgi:hypothetical protein